MVPNDLPTDRRPTALRDGTWTAAIAVWIVGSVALAIFMLLIAT